MKHHLPAKPFLWRSFDGSIWDIDTIKSDHAYNLMKMLWNEAAERYPELASVDKTPDGLRSNVSMQRRAVIVLQLFRELESRGGITALPVCYKYGYLRLRAEIIRLGRGVKLIEDKPHEKKNLRDVLYGGARGGGKAAASRRRP